MLTKLYIKLFIGSNYSYKLESSEFTPENLYKPNGNYFSTKRQFQCCEMKT